MFDQHVVSSETSSFVVIIWSDLILEYNYVGAVWSKIALSQQIYWVRHSSGENAAYIMALTGGYRVF